MKRAANRSSCPINLSLEVIGDTWSLLIIRDIIFAGKRSFREFLHSDEGIATNILKARLAALTANGIVSKSAHPTDMRRDIYSLTAKGIALVPVLVELAEWGLAFNPNAIPFDGATFGEDKHKAVKALQQSLAGTHSHATQP